VRFALLSIAAILTASRASADALSPIQFRAEPVRVNVISDTDQVGNVDGRGSLTETAAHLGLSGAEVEHIRAANADLTIAVRSTSAQFPTTTK